MAVHIHFVEQGSEEWDKAREDMYTGSNSEKLLGNIGVREYAKAKSSGFGGNFHTKRGHLLEDEALELYEQITGKKILRDDNGTKVGFVTNDKYTEALFSPDGWLEPDDEPHQEVKAFEIEKHLQLIRGDIPLKIMAQLQFGLTIGGKPYAELIPYHPLLAKRQVENEHGDLVDNPHYDPAKAFKIIRIPRNKAAIANFDRKLKMFAEYSKLNRIPR